MHGFFRQSPRQLEARFSRLLEKKDMQVKPQLLPSVSRAVPLQARGAMVGAELVEEPSLLAGRSFRRVGESTAAALVEELLRMEPELSTLATFTD
jgi:hypothetical protein